MTFPANQWGLLGEHSGFEQFLRMSAGGGGSPSEPVPDPRDDRGTVPSTYGDNGVYAEEPRATLESHTGGEQVLSAAPHVGALVSESTMDLPAGHDTGASSEPQESEPEPLEPFEHLPKMLTEFSKVPEGDDPSYEVRETETHILLVNTAHPDRAQVEHVAVELANGRPDSWVPADVTGTSSAFYTDDAETPSLSLKSLGEAEYQQHIRGGAERVNRDPEQFLEDALIVPAEVGIAPAVEAVLATDEVQAAANALGFADVAVVQPLIGAIDKQSGEQFMVYPWIHGDEGGTPMPLDRALTEAEREQIVDLSTLAESMKPLIREAGIASDDFGAMNFVVVTDEDGNRHLRIIDITDFRPLANAADLSDEGTTMEQPAVDEGLSPPTEPLSDVSILRESSESAPHLTADQVAILRERRAEATRISDDRVEQYTAAEKGAIERGGAVWGPHDATLDDPTDRNSFAAWFDGVVPEERAGLRDDIETVVAALPEEYRSIIEAGGTASTLVKGFSEGTFLRSLGVSLNDYRTADEKAAGAARRHTVVAGDLRNESTEHAVDTWLDGGQAGVVISRLFAGVMSIPRDPFTFSDRARFWYSKVAPGGLLYAHVPPAMAYHIDAWREAMVRDYPQVPIAVGRVGESTGRSVIRIHKVRGAPATLPLLDGHSVMVRELQRRDRYPPV